MQHPRFDELSQQLAQRSPIDVDGAPITVWLVGIRDDDAQPGMVVVDIGAREAHGQTHRGELHLSHDRLATENIVYLAVETMRQIVKGELPPGIREPL